MTVFPCSDDSTCIDDARAGVTSIDQNDHQHSSSEEDLCTPFCICSCCAAHIQIKNSTVLNSTDLFHNARLPSHYTEKPFLTNVGSIWQPPKC